MKTIDLPLIANALLNTIVMANIEGMNLQDIARGRESAKTMGNLDGWRHDLWVHFNQGWGIDATLNLKVYVKNEKLVVEPTVSWGTTSYTLDQAEKATKLHTAVVALARQIEAESK